LRIRIAVRPRSHHPTLWRRDVASGTKDCDTVPGIADHVAGIVLAAAECRAIAEAVQGTVIAISADLNDIAGHHSRTCRFGVGKPFSRILKTHKIAGCALNISKGSGARMIGVNSTQSVRYAYSGRCSLSHP
jgi:hypothetical protein